MHRDVAFQVFPYACIGQLHFLNLSLRTHPTYTQLLERLTQGSQTLLDLGSCFAQDLRPTGTRRRTFGAPPRRRRRPKVPRLGV